MPTLLIATRNAHKVVEIGQILGAGFRCLSLTGLPGAPAAVENADTFAGNASLKAKCLSDWLNNNPAIINRLDGPSPFYVLADDSGLEVDALAGAPGVHSARFAANDSTAGNSSDAANNAKLLRLLEAIPEAGRAARFRCVLALLRLGDSGGDVHLFEGTCEGRIARKPSGGGGFGYDPLFIPDGSDKSFAELGEDVKNESSHRARALQKLRDFFSKS